MSHTGPLAPIVSYSGPPYLEVTPNSGTFTSRLQAIEQAKQVPRPSMIVSAMVWPLISRAWSNCPLRKLWVGRIPSAFNGIMLREVPNLWTMSALRS